MPKLQVSMMDYTLKVQMCSTRGNRIIAKQVIRKGTILYSFSDCRTSKIPTYQTVQISPDIHIDDPAILALLNHSCNPNIVVDTTLKQCRALRNIEVGEELNFFYPSTEWEMSRPFKCWCGTSNCLGLIAGAKYLTKEILKHYFINSHISLMKMSTNQETFLEQGQASWQNRNAEKSL